MRLLVLRHPDGRDPLLRQAMQAHTKFARVPWRWTKGQSRWFRQLGREGLSQRKYKMLDGAIVGQD